MNLSTAQFLRFAMALTFLLCIAATKAQQQRGSFLVSDDDELPLTAPSVEQALLSRSRMYHQWRDHVVRDERPYRSESSSLDLELLDRIQGDTDAPPTRSFHQERVWRRQQRAEALMPGTYHHGGQRDVLPIGFESVSDRFRDEAQGGGSMLQLPSTAPFDDLALTTAGDGDDDAAALVPLPTRAKELKRFLSQRGVTCENCVELRDLVARAEAARRLPTAEDLAVAELTATPVFAVDSNSDRAEQLVEMMTELQASNPAAAQQLQLALSQRAWLRSLSHCKDPNVDWLGSYNTTLPAGCSISASMAMM